jgi:dienelactone hydrolase
MRIAEAALIVSAILLAGALLWGAEPDSRLVRVWAGVIFLAVCLQLYLIGIYWQVAPAYLASLVLLSLCFLLPRAPLWATRTLGSICILLLLASTAFLLILPTFRLPPPTGSFGVGTTILHVVDSSRSDQAFPSGKRELMVQVWYPTQARTGELAPYRRREETTLLSSYMAVLGTHSLKDAPIAKRNSPFPFLLFNPAWGGQRTQNTFLVEELASHGFIVAAIDHTHNSLPIAFPDGQLFDLSDPQRVGDPDTLPLKEKIEFYDRELDRQTEDDVLVLDTFARSNNTSGNTWFQRIDQNRIGALGHSFGGAVSLQTAFRDSRVRSALNLDGWNFGDLASQPLRKPLMLIYAQAAPPTDVFRVPHDTAIERVPLDQWDAANVRRTLSEYGGIVISIRGAKHFNFADRALYSPVRRLTEAGRIRPERAHLITNEYVLAFFSETLNGTYQPILHQNTSHFPEVTQEEWKPVQP